MKKEFIAFLGGVVLVTTTMTSSLEANTTPQKKTKPFLIQGRLPHLTMMVKQLWDDEDLALTPQQKQQLLKIRKETLTAAKALAKEIVVLENRVVEGSNAGVEPSKLQKDVEKIASLRAKATMVHLACIYDTRKVLTKEQLYILE